MREKEVKEKGNGVLQGWPAIANSQATQTFLRTSRVISTNFRAKQVQMQGEHRKCRVLIQTLLSMSTNSRRPSQCTVLSSIEQSTDI